MTDQLNTLVVDDEKGVRFFLDETLRRAGHTVSAAKSGEEALDRLRETPYDVVILDLKLGGQVDGLRVLEGIRWRWPETVVLILTAHGSLESAVDAINKGVDGYLIKPVKPGEVCDAVKNAVSQQHRKIDRTLKRRNRGQILQQGEFQVDLQKHQVKFQNKLLKLTPSEFTLLVHLMRNAHRVISPIELVKVVRSYECPDLNEARQIIKWYVHRLRSKLEPNTSNPKHILNIRGVGYRFVP